MNVALILLWKPILLSTIAVFLASNLVWLVLRYHHSDWKKLPDEDSARDLLKGLKPGGYSVPHATDNKQRADPVWQAKYIEGPAFMINVFPTGSLATSKPLAQWFTYCVVVTTLVAYIAGTALAAGTPYMTVFQVTATVSVLAYSGSSVIHSIWYAHAWSRTFKDILDGIIYGGVTAVIFSWLWP